MMHAHNAVSSLINKIKLYTANKAMCSLSCYHYISVNSVEPCTLASVSRLAIIFDVAK